MPGYFDQEIQFLPGVGPKRAEQLKKELQIHTFRDLLLYFPFKHIDRSKFFKIAELNSDMPQVQIRGAIIKMQSVDFGPKQRLSAVLEDETGEIDLLWLQGIKWIKPIIKPETEYIVFGKPSLYNNKYSMVHPEIEEAAKLEAKGIQPLVPVYNTTENLKKNFFSSKTIQKLISTLLQNCKEEIPENLPQHVVTEYKLMPRHKAIVALHFPTDMATLQKAKARFKFEELFFIQLKIQKNRALRMHSMGGIKFERKHNFVKDFYDFHKPFDFTGAQLRVLREIRKDVESGKQMNRLLQGDVGSGKTIVAMVAMLMAIDSGYQTGLMVPTEVLAMQHFGNFTRLLSAMNLNIKILTGSTKKKDRKQIAEELENGTLHILIGTHALLEDNVNFSNLGLVVIDEQHRFGVAQRARLWKKSELNPHILVMTATPIPRTLSMTLYGDLDVSVIDELPPGRQKIVTRHYTDAYRQVVFGKMREEIAKGRQIYVIYPLIEESEKLTQLKYLKDGEESIARAFPLPKYRIVSVHGQLSNEEKNLAMLDFKDKKAEIMIATTVVEVGVDVPNATMMVIENAERFGLSQLHQLRGRVGRGAHESYCYLVTPEKFSSDAKTRIQTMTSTTDGFAIAEVDLQLRGPGDIDGTQQSGAPYDLQFANLATDGNMVQFVKDVVENIYKNDPQLQLPENAMLARWFAQNENSLVNWRFIG